MKERDSEGKGKEEGKGRETKGKERKWKEKNER